MAVWQGPALPSRSPQAADQARLPPVGVPGEACWKGPGQSPIKEALTVNLQANMI